MEKCAHCGWSFNPTDPDDDCCPDCEALIMASIPDPVTLVRDGVETPEGKRFFASLFNH